MKIDLKRIVRMSFWPLLYIAFVVVAVLVRMYVVDTGITEIWGWDYGTFVKQIQNWEYISYFGFRHPGLGLILSPLVVFELFWIEAYLVVMPGVAVLTAYLIHRMAGVVGLIVWLSFPVTWLMAAIPESFPVAQLAMVFSMFLMGGNVSIKRVFVLAAVNSMITLTNGVKPLVAYVLTCRERRKIMSLGLIVIFVLITGVIFFYVRAIVCGRNCLSGIVMTLSWIPEKRNLLYEILGFFIRPVGVFQSLIVYPMLVYSLCSSKFRECDILVRNIVGFFSVDFILHLVIGWGMAEAWVFSPHWIFVIPIIIGKCVQLDCGMRG